MKLIKTYEGFFKKKEIPEINYKPLTENEYSMINYCFQDLVDNGFNIDLASNINTVNWLGGYIHTIHIYKDKKYFNLSDIEETLKFAIPYLDEELGVKIKKIKISVSLPKFLDSSPNDPTCSSIKEITFSKIDNLYILPKNKNLKSIILIYEIN